MTGRRERARGALLGLAVGDALGAPAENLEPEEIRARWGRVEGFVTDTPAGTDDTEYTIFSGLLLARYGAGLTAAHAEDAWRAQIVPHAAGPFKGAGFSERATVQNLVGGLHAPFSAQHRHAWSDGLAMRAAPFGVFAAGEPGEAARLIALEGSVSHAGEGIHGGAAVAAAVAVATAGGDLAAVLAAAFDVIPDDSWTARTLHRAVRAAPNGPEAIRAAAVVHGYPWTDLAPEAVGLAFGALVAADGDLRAAVLGAVNMGRDADTTAAVAGAIAGALGGTAAIGEPWAAAIGPSRGTCLPSVAGRHVIDIADLLTDSEAPPPRPAPSPRTRITECDLPAPEGEDRIPRGGEAGEAEPRERITGALLGTAAGDAAGWPAARHRAALLPGWTRRLARELDGFAEEHAITTTAVPFALNTPPEALELGPSDDAEWLVFTARAALEAAAPGDEAAITTALDAAWTRLAAGPPAGLHPRLSVRIALANLARGLEPPATGHDNPHYFDDAAAVRAVALGALRPGDPAGATRLARHDARVTNDADGAHGAAAIAAAVAAACGGAPTREVIRLACAQLPPGTEIARNAAHALELAENAGPGGAFGIVPHLEHDLVDHVYSYGVAAAETVPVALALTVAAGGAFAQAVPAAACLARLADSAPALTGALTGALGGAAGIPHAWRENVRRPPGCAVPSAADTDLIALAGRMAAAGR